MLLTAIVFMLLWTLLGASYLTAFGDRATDRLNGIEPFLGLGLMLHVMNILQLINAPVLLLSILIPISMVGFVQTHQKIKLLSKGHVQLFIVFFLAYCFYLFFLKPDIPMVSWDSWLGWELKAKQWLSHGFSVELVPDVEWLSDGVVFHNATATYPDGLPLLYYLGYLIGDPNNQIVGYLYGLFYFWLVFWVVLRFKKQGANWMVLLFAFLLLFSFPLLHNHLNLQGYADIWLAMYVLLCVCALSDWNQRHSIVSVARLILLLSLLPLFKHEGWVWLVLLVSAQIISKYLIRKHRLLLFVFLAFFVIFWFIVEPWSYSWAGRTVVLSQQLIKFGAFFELSLVPAPVGHEVFAGMFLQNNWGWIWYLLPFVVTFWVLVKHPKHQQVSQTFFVLSFVAFLFLFFFTGASKWAQNYTAVNRIVLQLTPVFAYLVIQTLVVWQQKRAGEPTLTTN